MGGNRIAASNIWHNQRKQEAPTNGSHEARNTAWSGAATTGQIGRLQANDTKKGGIEETLSVWQ
jgi:hypothetical protein